MAKVLCEKRNLTGVVDSHDAMTAAQWAIHQAMRQIMPFDDQDEVQGYCDSCVDGQTESPMADDSVHADDWVENQIDTQLAKYGDWEQSCIPSPTSLKRQVVSLADTIWLSERGFEDDEDSLVIDTFVAFQQWNNLFQALETLDRRFF